MPKFKLSDETINSYGFKVKTTGIETADFESNPVMLYNHNYDRVIGKWVNFKVKGKELFAEPEFDADDVDAMALSKKVEKGYIKGASIGIRVLEWAREENADGSVTNVALRSRLIEVSLTALPSNKNALRLYDENRTLMTESDITLSMGAASESFNPKPNMKISKENLTLLGLSENPTEDALNAAIQALGANFKTLKTAQEQANDKRAEDLVNLHLGLNKFTADKKVYWLKLAKVDFESTKLALENMASTKPSQFTSPQGKAANNVDADRKDWSLADWKQKDMPGLLKLKNDEPDAYNALMAKSGIKMKPVR